MRFNHFLIFAALCAGLSSCGYFSEADISEASGGAITIELSVSGVELPGEGGSVKVDVTCEKKCTIKLADASWGSVINQKWTEGKGGSFEISADENLEAKGRTNTITVSYGKEEKTLEVNQAAGLWIYGVSVPQVGEINGTVLSASKDGQSQISKLYTGNNEYSYSIIRPSDKSAFRLTGISTGLKAGNKVTLGVYAVLDGKEVFSGEKNCRVRKVSDKTYWIVSDKGLNDFYAIIK